MPTTLQATSWKWRAATLAVGYLANKSQVIVFDYLAYPLVIWGLGLFWGSIIMSGLSFIACWSLIKLYDFLKTDFLGFEALKAIKEEVDRPGALHRIVRWALRKSDPIALVVLSLWQDPFFTVAWMRHGAHAYNGLSRRDWMIFVASWVISNGWWIFLIFTGISVVQWFTLHLGVHV